MDDCYHEHCENLRMLNQGVNAVKKTLREHIAANDEHRVIIFTRIFSLIVDSWTEVRLFKLVSEYNAFSDNEKKKLFSPFTKVENKWLFALEWSFCKRFGINDPSLINSHPEGIKYEKIKQTIKKDLIESRLIRNRVAHGQWRVAFNKKITRVNHDITKSLKQDNILRIQFRLVLFDALAQIIQDLAVSQTAFVKNFDSNYKVIENQRQNLEYISYEKYRQKLIEKREKSKKIKESQTQN